MTAHAPPATAPPQTEPHVVLPVAPPAAAEPLVPAAAPIEPIYSQSPPQPVPRTEPTAEPLADVDVMLAMLAAEHRQEDPTSKWIDLFGDRSSRVLIIVSGTAVVGAVALLLFTVLGVIF